MPARQGAPSAHRPVSSPYRPARAPAVLAFPSLSDASRRQTGSSPRLCASYRPQSAHGSARLGRKSHRPTCAPAHRHVWLWKSPQYLRHRRAHRKRPAWPWHHRQPPRPPPHGPARRPRANRSPLASGSRSIPKTPAAYRGAAPPARPADRAHQPASPQPRSGPRSLPAHKGTSQTAPARPPRDRPPSATTSAPHLPQPSPRHRQTHLRTPDRWRCDLQTCASWGCRSGHI